MIRTTNSFGWSAAMPFFAVYLEVERGVGLGIIGAAYLVSGILSLSGQLLGGWLTDILGSKRVMLAGYVSSIVSSVLMSYMLGTKFSVLPIILVYVVFSFFRALSNPATSALIASQRSRSTITSGFSLQTMGGNIGFGLGPAVGGIISEHLGYPFVFILSAASACTALTLALGLIKFNEFPNDGVRTRIGSLRLRAFLPVGMGVLSFLGVVVVLYFVDGALYTPLSLYSAGFIHLSNQDIGLLFTTNGLLIVALQIPLIKLFERVGRINHAPALAAILMAAAYVVIANTRSFEAYVIAMGVATVGEILLTVPTQLIITSLSSPDNRGAYQGYYSAATSAGRTLASFITPITFELLFPPSNAWLAVCAVSLAGGLAYLVVLGKISKKGFYTEKI
ncbi:MAG: MFS transporter [Thermoprotei archaeon]